jgi:hypothetical protein
MTLDFLNTHCHWGEPLDIRTRKHRARQILNADWPKFNFWGI